MHRYEHLDVLLKKEINKSYMDVQSHDVASSSKASIPRLSILIVRNIPRMGLDMKVEAVLCLCKKCKIAAR